VPAGGLDSGISGGFVNIVPSGIPAAAKSQVLMNNRIKREIFSNQNGKAKKRSDSLIAD
jgi:hypothetical protein